ncbi:hypothetical protein C8Q75DRAFT_706235, partial [Abortiporus biennis]
KILSVTADNISSNDTMTIELLYLIKAFPDDVNCVHCFDYIINLIAKSLLQQFD